jgi:hypothetical protein
MKQKNSKVTNVYEKCYLLLVEKLTELARSYAHFPDTVSHLSCTIALVEEQKIRYMDETGAVNYCFALGSLEKIFRPEWWVKASEMIANRVDEYVGRDKVAMTLYGTTNGPRYPAGHLPMEGNDAYKECWGRINLELTRYYKDVKKKGGYLECLIEIMGYMKRAEIKHMNAEGSVNYNEALQEFEFMVKWRRWENPHALLREAIEECGINICDEGIHE